MKVVFCCNAIVLTKFLSRAMINLIEKFAQKISIIFQLYLDAGGRSLLIEDQLENY